MAAIKGITKNFAGAGDLTMSRAYPSLVIKREIKKLECPLDCTCKCFCVTTLP